MIYVKAGFTFAQSTASSFLQRLCLAQSPGASFVGSWHGDEISHLLAHFREMKLSGEES